RARSSRAASRTPRSAGSVAPAAVAPGVGVAWLMGCEPMRARRRSAAGGDRHERRAGRRHVDPERAVATDGPLGLRLAAELAVRRGDAIAAAAERDAARRDDRRADEALHLPARSRARDLEHEAPRL